jgi:hypothetical protein
LKFFLFFLKAAVGTFFLIQKKEAILDLGLISVPGDRMKCHGGKCEKSKKG